MAAKGTEAQPQVEVGHADNVNVPAVPNHLPYVRIITAVTFTILVGFAAISYWVIVKSKDATMIGSIVQTWNNLAIAAATFWVGSSLAGKMASSGQTKDKEGGRT